MPKPIIYISGPLSAETEAERQANVKLAIAAGVCAYHAGAVPFIPHLNHAVGPVAESLGLELAWGDYMAWDIPIIGRCDGLIRLPGASKGADVEAVLAEEHGIPVMHVPSWDAWGTAVAGDELEDFVELCQEQMNAE